MCIVYDAKHAMEGGDVDAQTVLTSGGHPLTIINRSIIIGSDLASNWDIDIASSLEDYLEGA